MAQAGKHARQFQDWTTQLPTDALTTFDLLSSEAIARPGLRYLAGALNYCLTQLDLIPDHEKAGAVDDAFVLRVAYGLAAEHANRSARAETGATQTIARMTHDEDEIRALCGAALCTKLREYVLALADKPVRNRSVDHILDDAKVREGVKRELEQTMKKLKPVLSLTDAEAEQIEVSVKSYLTMKLK